MLVDILLACAPIVVVAPVVVTLLATHVDFTPKRRLQRRLINSLAVAEKLPVGVVGSAQIARDIDRQTLRVAYLTQYPHRSRELRDIAQIGIGLAGALAVYYALLWADGRLLYLLAFLGLIVVAALWLERVVVNFARNDKLALDLFAHFGAPQELVRPHTELVLKAPTLTTEMVFERATGIRDAHHDGPMTTLDAVNSVLAQAHTHGAWRREAGLLAHRVIHADYRGHAASAYDLLLWRLLRPFFKWRLAYLDDRERGRAARAQKAGDVYKAAWLATYYHDERRRLARHWSHLRLVRDPLLRRSTNGVSSTPEPPPYSSRRRQLSSGTPPLG